MKRRSGREYPCLQYVDVKIRDGFTTFDKIDELDVKILEELSLMGPRNVTLIAEHLRMPTTTVRYRFIRMMNESILFLHANPYHTNIGLKKAEIFVEAVQGYEDLLLDCLKVNDFWVSLSSLYRPEGFGGVWMVPKDNVDDFKVFLKRLVDLGVAKNVEINWTTCHEEIPVRGRWFNNEENRWVFNWSEWLNEVEIIEGELPWTLKDPDDWPMNFDYIDLIIIIELGKVGNATMTDISKNTGISVETLKYHMREHVLKRDLIAGYQIEIFRFPPLSSESLFFKFDFDSQEKLVKFALALLDKPFPIHISKVIGENALTSQIYIPKTEFRKLIKVLSILIRKGLLKKYNYWIQDSFAQWRQTIPYKHFENGEWKYDADEQLKELANIIKKSNFISQR